MDKLVLKRQASRKRDAYAQIKESNPETELHSGTIWEEERNQSNESPETETPRILMERFCEFIGDTPLVELTSMSKELKNPHVHVYAKCEFFNPGFSIKDRIVQNIFSKAEESGKLRKGMTVVAASSGNTGAATAMMCAMKGYDCIITTSPKCSQEKMDAIKAYGAQLLVSPEEAKEGDRNHYMEMARLLALEDPEKYFDMDQYENKLNPEGHYLTLGPEIFKATKGAVTHFVAAGSTGGTISGTGKYLKEQDNRIKVVLADPVGSIFTNYFRTGELGKPGKFLVEGVGKGSIPGAMDFSVIDSVLPVSDQEAFDMCHRLCREEGICAGGSGGLNVHAALKLAESLNEPAIIVTVLPDMGVKYLSKIYNPDWLSANGFRVPDQGEEEEPTCDDSACGASCSSPVPASCSSPSTASCSSPSRSSVYSSQPASPLSTGSASSDSLKMSGDEEEDPESVSYRLRRSRSTEDEDAGSPEQINRSRRFRSTVSSGSSDSESGLGVNVDAYRYRDLVGETPLLDFSHLVSNPRCRVNLHAKCEFFNPGFSIKDRIVQNIIAKAEASGKLREGMTVVAASSGNTGASTAMFCAMKGYKCIITTSPKCSKEKMDAIKAYGAKLLISPDSAKEGDRDHYMEMARLLALEDPDKYFDMDQYENKLNPEGHYLTLGPEIWEETNGTITHFVAAGSTGGTISGTGRFLKERNEEVKVVLGDPVGSIFTEYFNKGTYSSPGKFHVEGVGKGSIPGAMQFSLIDQVVPVTDQQAFDTCYMMCRKEGLCAGGSSGLNLFAAIQLANSLEEDATVVTVLPDLGIKYLSKIYNREWLLENGLTGPEDSVFVDPSRTF